MDLSQTTNPQNIQSSERKSDSDAPEHKTQMVITHVQCSIWYVTFGTKKPLISFSIVILTKNHTGLHSTSGLNTTLFYPIDIRTDHRVAVCTPLFHLPLQALNQVLERNGRGHFFFLFWSLRLIYPLCISSCLHPSLFWKSGGRNYN